MKTLKFFYLVFVAGFLASLYFTEQITSLNPAGAIISPALGIGLLFSGAMLSLFKFSAAWLLFGGAIVGVGFFLSRCESSSLQVCTVIGGTV
jgi:hypothetical protein